MNSLAQSVLSRILPYEEIGESELPLIKWIENGDKVSILLLSEKKAHVGRFFYEMISRWLLPGERLEIDMFFFTDFTADNGREYMLSEILFQTEEMSLRHFFSMIEMEIRLGAASFYQANRILEIKGLSGDEKRALIQERISSLIQRRPDDFDYDIFGQMQHFLVMCSDSFRKEREYEQMSRIIYIFYLFGKAIKKLIDQAPLKRYVSLKMHSTRLYLPLGVKRVLSIFVGINFLKNNEIFEERHLLKAIQNQIPAARAIENSFFASERREDPIHLLYLEIEKEDGKAFSLFEIKLLKSTLAKDLKNSVEQLMPPIFMPRNEEEVMRYMITLSGQLKYTKDLPQVIVSFEEQIANELSFTVIFVRILMPQAPSIQEIFQRAKKTDLIFIPDRVKKIGMLRKKYPKEATVFRVRLSNQQFLRSDHSVDLYKARQAVVGQLQIIFGEFRDFNGGMIAKQMELFLSLKKELGQSADQHPFLLENFFHSIFPVEQRSMLDAELLKTLFLMFLEEGTQTKQERSHVFFTTETGSAEKYLKAVEVLKPIYVHFKTYLGFIYFCDDPLKQRAFLQLLDIRA